MKLWDRNEGLHWRQPDLSQAWQPSEQLSQRPLLGKDPVGQVSWHFPLMR